MPVVLAEVASKQDDGSGCMDKDNNEEYLKTTTVSGWVVLSAVLVLLAVLVAWAFAGTMLNVQDVMVFSTEQGVVGCLGTNSGQPSKLRKGMEVRFADQGSGTIKEVHHYVYTADEVEEAIGPYLQEDAQGFYVLFDIDTASAPEPYTSQPGYVVLSTMRPIDYWLAGDAS